MIPKTFTLVNKRWMVRIVTSKQLQRHLDSHFGDDPHPMEAKDLKGLCDPGANRIFVNKDLHSTEEDLQHTFWHEFVHALWFAEGLSSDEHDEQQVDRIGGILHQFDRTRKC